MSLGTHTPIQTPCPKLLHPPYSQPSFLRLLQPFRSMGFPPWSPSSGSTMPLPVTALICPPALPWPSTDCRHSVTHFYSFPEPYLTFPASRPGLHGQSMPGVLPALSCPTTSLAMRRPAPPPQKPLFHPAQQFSLPALEFSPLSLKPWSSSFLHLSFSPLSCFLLISFLKYSQPLHNTVLNCIGFFWTEYIVFSINILQNCLEICNNLRKHLFSSLLIVRL